MSFLAQRPLRLALIALLSLGATLAAAQSAWACEVPDRYDYPRPCTFLEKYGECLWGVFDAQDQCFERKESFLDGLRCHAATQVDLLACNLGLPFDFLGSILNPLG
jgi:hypothetical protein